MALAEGSTSHKVLLVDDDGAVRDMMTATLEHKGFKVVPAANVTEALKYITTESFDVLLTDLHMPNPGDGFTVVTAMRHSQPDALTLLVSKCPTNAPIPEANFVFQCPDERSTEGLSTQTTHARGSSTIGGRIHQQRDAAERVLPQSAAEFRNAESASEEANIEE